MSKPLTPKLRFKGFTDEWKTDIIGNVTRTFSGGTPTAGNEVYYGGAIPFIRSGEIHGNSTELFLTEEGLAKSSAAIVSKGTILYALYGATSGEVAISQIDGAINQAILAIIPNENFDSYCLSYWLAKNKLPIINTYLQGGQGNLSGAIVKSFEFKLPKTSEQREIGEYFKQIDGLIWEVEREIQRLEKMKLASLQKMFPRPGTTNPEIRFAGFTGDWAYSRLGDILSVCRGGSPRPIEAFITTDKNGLNWIKIGDVEKDARYITHTAEKIRPEGLSHTRQVYPGDLILSNSMSFGRPYIMQIEGCIHDGWLLIRDYGSRFDKEFLQQLLGSPMMLEQYRSLAAGGVVNNLNSDLVQSSSIIYPSLAEQKAIGEYFRNLDELISAKRQKLAKLRNIKASCLDKMFVSTSEL